MASFTMELKNVIQVCDIGLKKYPIFDESHRDILNKKIIDTYFTREIGIESVDDWVMKLNVKMANIMPKYNQLYKSELLNFDPLITMDMKQISDSNSESNSDTTANNVSKTDSESEELANQNSTTTTDSKARVVNSTTPQKRLAGNMDYASGGTDTTSLTGVDNDATSGSNASSTVNNNSDTTSNVSNNDSAHGESSTKGYSGSPSALLQEFRDTILNIDLEIIEELDELFMQIWTNGDQYTNNYYQGGFRYGYGAII